MSYTLEHVAQAMTIQELNQALETALETEQSRIVWAVVNELEHRDEALTL
jgi:hypothetical protein